MPKGIATTSGMIPGVIFAFTRTFPTDDSTHTQSSFEMPAAAAVSGWISA